MGEESKVSHASFVGYKFHCPNPEHDDSTPSFHIYEDRGYCFGCGYVLREDELSLFLQSYPPHDTGISVKQRSDFISHKQLASNTGIERLLLVQEWLESSGLYPVDSITIRFNVFDSDIQEIILSSRSGGVRHGETAILSYKFRVDPRYCDPDEMKYLNAKDAGTTIVRPTPHDSGPILVCEGELDAYLLSRFGWDTITTSSGSQSLTRYLWQELRYLSRPLYAAMDRDPAGDKAFAELQAAFPQISRLCWPVGNDVSDYLCSVEEEQRWIAIQNLICSC
jgi:hypothetical protein